MLEKRIHKRLDHSYVVFNLDTEAEECFCIPESSRRGGYASVLRDDVNLGDLIFLVCIPRVQHEEGERETEREGKREGARVGHVERVTPSGSHYCRALYVHVRT